jgi:NAD(P)-dependent dehydrogenase (short-subunit alcohol dehydrogenase family)
MAEPTEEFRDEAQRAVEEERDIQEEVDSAEAKSFAPKKDEKPKAMQAGAREYPAPPLPQQHLEKPGLEADLELQPLWDAPYYKGSEKLKDMAAIITGGDSGIGRSVAVLFAREGCDVLICHLNEDEDAELTKAAVEKEGRRCLTLSGDVADPKFADAAIELAMAQFDRLDILVNNAAFQEHIGGLDELTDEHFDRTIKTNLYGYFYMARAAVKVMKPKSSIINCGSVTGIRGSKELLDYSMTKGGIHAFTRALSGSLIEKGIRVNCVAPGPVWTPLNPADKSDVSEFGAQAKMHRPAQPEEIAPAFVFLASPQTASYITGEILPVIGGY